jgi:hypothetical protein
VSDTLPKVDQGGQEPVDEDELVLRPHPQPDDADDQLARLLFGPATPAPTRPPDPRLQTSKVP